MVCPVDPQHRDRARRLRRLAIAALALLLPALGLAQGRGFMSSYETEAIGDGLYTFRYGPYRNIFLVGDEGVIVTDPLKVAAAEALLGEIRKLTDKPIRFVAYSHSHWDHVVGGGIFRQEGATFVAQEKCLDNIRETPRDDLVPPDIVFADELSLSVGNRSLDMHYFGVNHGNCLSVMVARPANIAFIVDLANPPTGWHLEWNPTIPDTYLWNLVPSLAAIEEFAARENITQFVGGHVSIVTKPEGGMAIAPAVGPMTAVTERRQFWELIFQSVSDEMATGTFGDMVPNKMDRTVIDGKIGPHDPNDLSMMLRRVASYIYTGF